MSMQFFLPSPSLHSSKLKTVQIQAAVRMFRSTSGRDFLGTPDVPLRESGWEASSSCLNMPWGCGPSNPDSRRSS